MRASTSPAFTLMNQRPPRTLAAPSSDLVARFAGIVGHEHALTDARDQQPYLTEWRDLYVGRTPLVLRPGSLGEVARIMSLANEAQVAIVPQGGNTGLVGGQIPSESGTEIVLSLARMKRIRAIDPAGASMTVEAGLTLSEAQAAAAERGRLFPLSMASEGSCTIGGNLATNAGGVAVLAYGTARNLVLGLEVVTAEGEIWDGLKALKKDNTGYDLKDLFIGSEGTLGIITAATLKLFPAPREKATALAAVPRLDDLLPLFRLAADEAGSALTAFEFLSERALAFVAKHTPGARMPFAAAAPWYVLLEISGMEEGQAESLLERILAAAAERGVVSDAVIARSLAQAQAMSEAQKGEGGSIKHDVSVPTPLIAEFIARAADVVERICPGARPVPFGHFGDGNVHYNVSQPLGMDRAPYLKLWGPMSRAVHDLVTELGGSISAEHGIGRLKRSELPLVKSAAELDIMRRIKAALDPNGILNPGKLL
jgi:FAD/FMN-containing dehydrogenase